MPGHPTPQAWPAIEAAGAHDAAARVPFAVREAGLRRPAGSVARAHLLALRSWPDALQIDADGVLLTAPPAQREAVLATIGQVLRAAGLVRAWRDEAFELPALDDGRPLARIERATARFWGSLTLGAHCNGWVAGADSRPAWLWIARRADTKPTDPGLLDNLIGGGVPAGQSPAQCVLREGWEEAGLTPAQMAGLRPGRVIRLLRDIPEGLQREDLHVFDLQLPPGLQPSNQDGEVQAITCLPVAEALARAAAGEMTVDASLATLDFALRHHLLPAAEAAALAARAASLWRGPTALPAPEA